MTVSSPPTDHIQAPSQPSPLSSALITFDKVTLGYGRRVVLENLSFVLRSGDYVGIVGPNGAGKTTLLRAILARSGRLPAPSPATTGREIRTVTPSATCPRRRPPTSISPCPLSTSC
jgi:ATPase subunit of ABC transporter with duplicated ATPase domains